MKGQLQRALFLGEKKHGVWSSGARWNQNRVEDSKEIELSTQIKLVRYGVARYHGVVDNMHSSTDCSIRVVTEQEGYSVYYTTENSRIYHEKEPQYLDLDEEVQ